MKELKVTYFRDLFKSNDRPYVVEIQKAFDRIKKGAAKDKVEAIRQVKDKEERDELKRGLPCILFAGEFSERKTKGLISHSGLMVVDFDKYPSEKEMLKDLKALKKNPHFVALFISPSGIGIKGVVKIPPCEAKDHTKYFKQFEKEFKYKYFDKNNSNVDRVCFESYDPNIYINYEAELYEPQLIDEGYSIAERVPILPITDEDKIISKIMAFDWSKDFREGERNEFIFDLAGMFCEYGVTESAAVGYILNNVVIGDFPEKEAEIAIASAYKIRNANSRYFEDYNKITYISKDLKHGKEYVINEHKIDEKTFNEIKETKEHEDFWYTDKKGIKIDPFKYKMFLERNGFKKFFPNGVAKPNFVNIKSNIVSETSVEKIKDFVLDYLSNKGEIDVWSYCAGYQNLFSEPYLLMLESIELMMLRDEKDKSFLAFQNGILEITKDEVKLIDYVDVDGYIWETQIIKRDFTPLEDDSNDYKTFINNISDKDPFAMECTIGYLLSTYKNKLHNKAVILNDEVISDSPEGGTGKGLFVQGLEQARKVTILDGKTFSDQKSFPYQTVAQDCNVLVFDDVAKNFNFEAKFSLVTEGLTLERKNKDAIKLSIEESPKIVITTNYAIKGDGNSHNRRRHELEVAQYYGPDKTPEDDFNRELFKGWSEDDFNRFDNYIVYCLQSYLKEGLVEQNAKNLKLRKLISSTDESFLEWMDSDDGIKQGVRVSKKEVIDDFRKIYVDFDRHRNKTIIRWVKKWAAFYDVKYTEGNTAGLGRWLMLGEEKIDKEDESLPF